MRGGRVEEVQIRLREIHVVRSPGEHRPRHDVVRPRHLREEEIVKRWSFEEGM